MATPNEAKPPPVEPVAPVENEKLHTIETAAPRSDSEDEPPLARAQTTMTKTKWLACIALCLCYTTAFQQNACTSAIVKHIDAELGMSFRNRGVIEAGQG
jgi:hypothetical protein